jgi:beta-lactam-binding protein with PASTA domain
MASESERGPADDDVVVDPNGRAGTEDTTLTGEQWPVDDHYYVSPGEDASPHSEFETEETTVITRTAVAPLARRRFPPDVRPGVPLAILGVVVALILGAVLLGLDDGDPAATATPPTNASPTNTVETTPATPPAPAKVAVVDVEGMGLADAREALEAQDLRIRVTRSPSERPRGEVLGQAPLADSEVAKGTVVALVLSDGADEAPPTQARAQVPEVIGMSASDAVSAIRDAGLEARIRLVTSSERRGTVVDQTPAAGIEVTDGGTIQLEVARSRLAVRRIEVPDVVGSTAAAARSELRSAGLAVSTVTVVSEEPAGTVIEQSPGAGTELRKGGNVKLTVSAGPAKVDVPDVTGLDEASAQLELERAGFQVRVIDESTTDPAQDGLVLRQAPEGGSSAQGGAVVILTVGRLD